MTTIPELKPAEHLIKMVIEKLLTSVILISEGGLGKSYLAVTTLKRLCPNNYEYVPGHVTPLALYKLLFENHNKIIIFDDVEELLCNQTSIGILRAALWPVDGKRNIKYKTTSDKACDVPDSFEFYGGVILLCNRIPNEADVIIKAMKSRSAVHEIKLSYTQKLRIMKDIIDEKSDLQDNEKKALKDYLEKNTSIATKNFNLRTMEKLVAYYKYGKDRHRKLDELCSPLFKATNEEDENRRVVWELMNKKGWKVNKQLQYFIQETGMSRRTFFRYKKELIQELKQEGSVKVPIKKDDTNGTNKGGKDTIKVLVNKIEEPDPEPIHLNVEVEEVQQKKE